MDIDALAGELAEELESGAMWTHPTEFVPELAKSIIASRLRAAWPTWYSVHRVGQLRRGQGPAVASAAILGWARVRGGGR
jgi:hypothetical protein